MGGGYVIDLDIKIYLKAVNKRQIQGIFHRRVHDGVLHRLLGSSLNWVGQVMRVSLAK